MDDLVLVSQFLFFSSLAFYRIINRLFWGLSTAVYFAYSLVCGISIILYYHDFSFGSFHGLSLFSTVLFSGSIWLFSLPLLRFEKVRSVNMEMGQRALRLISFSCFVVSLLNLIYVFNSPLDSVLSLLVDESTAEYLYQNSRSMTNSGSINIYGVFFMLIRDFVPFFLLITISQRAISKLNVFFLSFSMGVIVFSGISLALRSSIVFLLFDMLFIIIIARRIIERQTFKWLRRTFMVLGTIVLIPLFVISTGRFDTGYSSLGNSNYATIFYLGQAPLNFSKYALDAGGVRYGDRTIYLFKSVLGFEVPKDGEERRVLYSKMKIDDSSFINFVGDFILDFGPFLGLVIVICLAWISFLLVLRGGRPKLSNLLVVFFVWSVLLKGLFLFPYADNSGNLRIIAYALLYYYFQRNELKFSGIRKINAASSSMI